MRAVHLQRGGYSSLVPIAASLRSLDRRVLGAGKYPGRKARQALLDDARQGRPLAPKLVSRTQDWAPPVLGPRSRRLRMLPTVILVAVFVFLVALALSDHFFWGGVGGLLLGAVGSGLSLVRERKQARAVLAGGLHQQPGSRSLSDSSR